MSLARVTPARREILIRRVRFLVAFTIAYNVIEAAVALTAGSIAGSSALLGFGLDSVIEVSSAAAVAWQFAGPDHEARERVALRVIAFSFFGLAAFVTYDATSALVNGEVADHSSLGIGIAALSLAVMPIVSWIQRRAGNELGSHSAVADSKQTLLCTYMSAALLLGLVANSLLGWWWARPCSRTRHRRARRTGGPQRLAGRRLLCARRGPLRPRGRRVPGRLRLLLSAQDSAARRNAYT